MRYVREQGYPDEQICLAIKEANPDMDCCGGECDCARLGVAVAAAVAALALFVAVRTRNKAAMRMAVDAIARARSTSSQIGRAELLATERELVASEAEMASAEVQLKRVLDTMRFLEENAFSGAAGTVRIIP